MNAFPAALRVITAPLLFAGVALSATAWGLSFDAPLRVRYVALAGGVGLMAGGIAWWLRRRVGCFQGSHSYGCFARLALMLLSCFLLMLAWAQWRWVERVANPVPSAWNAAVQTVDVRIVSMPTRTDFGWRMAVVPLQNLSDPAPRLPVQMSLSWADNHLPEGGVEALRAGQVWRLPLHIRTPHATRNEGVFDYERYWLAHEIPAVAYVRVYKKSTVFPQRLRVEPSLGAWVENCRFDLLQSIDAQLMGAPTQAERDSARVFKALALGDQASVLAAQWQLFQDTGITHLVSISGAHVTLLAGVLAWLAYRLWKRNARLVARVPALHVAQWVALLGAWAYALMAGWGLPAQRTVMMLACWLVLARLGVARNGVRVLAWCVGAVLLYDPFAVWDMGFWLSFGAVAWLILAFERMDGAEQAHDDQPLWRRWLRYACTAGAVQLGIGLSLLPMTLYFFKRASLLGVAVNFFAIPLVSVLLLPLLGSVLVLAISGWGEPLLWVNRVLAWCLQGLTDMQQLGARMGWQHAYWIGRIEVWQVVGLFVLSLGLVWQLRHWFGGTDNHHRRALIIIGLAGLAMVTLLRYPPHYPIIDKGQLRATILDVGQGSAVLLQSANHTWLYDAGSRYSSQSDAGARVILPYLHHIGVRRIDTLILSHNDIDHTGGARSIAHILPIGEVLTSLTQEQLTAVGLADVPMRRCQRGQKQVVDGIETAVFSPAAETLDDAHSSDNQKSCVLRFAPLNRAPDGENSILLTGDIDQLQEARMLVQTTAEPASADAISPNNDDGEGSNDNDNRMVLKPMSSPSSLSLKTTIADTPVQSDIVLIPHHGSRHGSSAPLIAATRPHWAVAQVGMYNPFRHPDAGVLQRYRDAGAQTWRTDTQYSRVFVLGRAEP